MTIYNEFMQFIVINNDLMSKTRPAAEFGHQVDIFQAA